MKNYTKWVTSSILISILSITVVFILTRDTTTTAVVREIRPGYILAALVIHIFSFVIWGLRIKSMTGALGHKIGLLRSFEIVVSGTFVAALTPSSIGGEPFRILLLSQDKMPVGKATAVISVEYPASLLRGWKTSPRTVNNNMIYQFRFRFVNFCSN